jgi:hypothetical protein
MAREGSPFFYAGGSWGTSFVFHKRLRERHGYRSTTGYGGPCRLAGFIAEQAEWPGASSNRTIKKKDNHLNMVCNQTLFFVLEWLPVISRLLFLYSWQDAKQKAGAWEPGGKVILSETIYLVFITD